MSETIKKEFEGKKVLVEGLGRTGVSLVRILSSMGAQVVVHDPKPSSDLAEQREKISGCAGYTGLFGVELDAIPAGVELVVLSPGVPTDLAWIKNARDAGIEVIGDIELFARLLPKHIRLVAISGTNGKSTTTALIGHILRTAGYKVFVGGNIGTAALDIFAQDEDWEFAVVELSSFQLDTTSSLHAHIAVLLNITPDHMDRYPSFDAYRQSKARLFMNQTKEDFAVINQDDSNALLAAQSTPAQKRYFSAREELPRGAFLKPGAIVFRSESGEEQYMTSRYQLYGMGNMENMMAAINVARILNIEPAVLERALSSFAGLEHRLEFVGEYRTIRFFNDSKATNPEAALKSLSGFEEPVVWIAGGKNKQLDFSILKDVACKSAKAAFFFGESASAIADAVGDCIPVSVHENLEQAFAAAIADLEPGDVVLLSPACASFDQYANFEERGRHFKQLVEEFLKDKN